MYDRENLCSVSKDDKSVVFLSSPYTCSVIEWNFVRETKKAKYKNIYENGKTIFSQWNSVYIAISIPSRKTRNFESAGDSSLRERDGSHSICGCYTSPRCLYNIVPSTTSAHWIPANPFQHRRAPRVRCDEKNACARSRIDRSNDGRRSKYI